MQCNNVRTRMVPNVHISSGFFLAATLNGFKYPSCLVLSFFLGGGSTPVLCRIPHVLVRGLARHRFFLGKSVT